MCVIEQSFRVTLIIYSKNKDVMPYILLYIVWCWLFISYTTSSAGYLLGQFLTRTFMRLSNDVGLLFPSWYTLAFKTLWFVSHIWNYNIKNEHVERTETTLRLLYDMAFHKCWRAVVVWEKQHNEHHWIQKESLLSTKYMINWYKLHYTYKSILPKGWKWNQCIATCQKGQLKMVDVLSYKLQKAWNNMSENL